MRLARVSLFIVSLACTTALLAQTEPCCDPNERPGALRNPLCAAHATCCDDGLRRCDLEDGEPACPGGVGQECVQICGGAGHIPCDLPDRFCKVEEGQCGRLADFRRGRDQDATQQALDAIRKAARDGDNLMPHLVEGAIARCTLGEMVQAMADVYGRYTSGPEW